MKNFKFKKIVTPGDQLNITCKSQSKLGHLLEIQVVIRDENKKRLPQEGCWYQKMEIKLKNIGKNMVLLKH